MFITELITNLKTKLVDQPIRFRLDDKHCLTFSSENDERYIPHFSVKDNLEKAKLLGKDPITFGDVKEKLTAENAFSLLLTDSPSEEDDGNYWRIKKIDKENSTVSLSLCDHTGLFAYVTVTTLSIPFDYPFFTTAYVCNYSHNEKPITLPEGSELIKSPNKKIYGEKQKII